MRDYKKLYEFMLDDEKHKQILRNLIVKSITCISDEYPVGCQLDISDDLRLLVELNGRNEPEYMTVDGSGASEPKSRKEMIEFLWKPEYGEFKID